MNLSSVTTEEPPVEAKLNVAFVASVAPVTAAAINCAEVDEDETRVGGLVTVPAAIAIV